MVASLTRSGLASLRYLRKFDVMPCLCLLTNVERAAVEVLLFCSRVRKLGRNAFAARNRAREGWDELENRTVLTTNFGALVNRYVRVLLTPIDRPRCLMLDEPRRRCVTGGLCPTPPKKSRPISHQHFAKPNPSQDGQPSRHDSVASLSVGATLRACPAPHYFVLSALIAFHSC